MTTAFADGPAESCVDIHLFRTWCTWPFELSASAAAAAAEHQMLGCFVVREADLKN